ncbi:MAG: AtpZ/AtpI family protein [Bacteroidota bacterium]|nr:AtpZ/AtpI family protein [Bacteroidota bacterium]
MKPLKNKKNEDFFSGQIAEKERQKLKALREKNGGVWMGLGMMGMIGWSVAVPTLLGTAMGFWLDKKYPQTFSWTLSWLVIGLCSGSLIAWYWVAKEDKEMHNDKEENDE